MKRVLITSASFVPLVSAVAQGNWSSSAGSFPQVCVANGTEYPIEISVNGQFIDVAPHATTRFPSYTYDATEVQMNTRQLSEPGSQPNWAGFYVWPAYGGCTKKNKISISLQEDGLSLNWP